MADLEHATPRTSLDPKLRSNHYAADVGPEVSKLREADRELRVRLIRRDPDALAEAYNAYAGHVFGLARSMLGDVRDAEEVVSDTFLQVWRTVERYDATRGPFVGWIMAICRSRSLDKIRSRRRRAGIRERERGQIVNATTPDPAPSPADVAVARVDVDRVVEPALGGLPDDQREAIELAYWSGLTQSQIAQRLDVPLGTVKTRIRTGMRALRDALIPSGASEAEGDA